MANLSNINNKFLVTTGGNVGIGVTGPLGKIHVGLPAYTNEDTNSQQAIFGASNGYGVRIGYNETDNKGYINVLKPGVAWGSLILQEDVGKVGIGTTSPSQKLHVNSSTNNPTGIGLQNSERYYSVRSNNYSLVFTDETVGTERMRIDSSGNIGISGNTSAWSLGKTIQINSNYGTINYNGVSAILGIVNAYYNGSGYIRQNVGYAASIDFNTAISGGGLAFRTENSTGAAGDTISLTTKVAILSNGNVGIGTTVANGKLHIADTSSSSTTQYFSAASNTATYSYIKHIDNTVNTSKLTLGTVYGYNVPVDAMTIYNGNVGIGVDPDEKLDVYGNIKIGTTANSNVLNRSNSHWVQYNGGATTNNTYIRVASVNATGIAKTVSIFTDATERMRIDSIGRMGFNSGIQTDTRHYFYSNNNTGAATGVALNIKIKSTQYSGTHVQFVGSQGNGGTIGYSNLTASYNTTGSDERLKKNITNWNENILDKFKNIKPKEFHFNQQEDSEEKQKGYIAQNEVDKFPEAYPLLYDDVSKEDRHQFNPSGMVVYLMKAIQELKAEIDELKK